MRSFQRGEKSKVGDLTPSQQLEVGLALVGGQGEVYDISLFGLDAQGQLSDDRYFIFFNQKTSPEGALSAGGAQGGDAETFTVDLDRLPATIEKLAFTATIDGNGQMSGISSGYLRISAQGAEVARFTFTGADFAGEKAIIIAEIYRKDIWRFAAVGQGFNGGLSALLAHFGGEESGAAAPPPAAPPSAPPAAPPAAPPPPPPPPAPPTGAPPAGAPPMGAPPAGAPPQQPPPAQPGAPAAPAVNLSKVTLEKQGSQRTVSLQKGGNAPPIHINLNWNQQGGKRRGILSGKSSAPDLDLGCMYELKDGTRSVIQPLGNRFGDRNGPPWIFLDKDDRSGAATDGENLWLVKPDAIQRVMVFAMIYEGARDFQSVGGHMTIRDQNGGETLVQLNNPDANRTFCSICMISTVGDSVTITKEERYFKGHRDADEFYGFGFQWTAGSK